MTNNKEDISDGILYKPLCNPDIARITSSEALLSRKFTSHDLLPQHRHNLHIRAYVDYYGGYAEHGRQVVLGLADTGEYNIRLHPLKTPIDIDPITKQKLDYFAFNANVGTKYPAMLHIAGMGYMQEKYLDKNKINVGWTMTETREYADMCKEWINSPQFLLCPTDLDMKRALNAGVPSCKLHKVHLGFDNKLYHNKVEPIKLVGIDNSRFVFGFVGSWNTRKSVKEILHAYFNAFTQKDKVTLLMVSKYGTRPFGKEKQNADRWTIQHEFDEVVNTYNYNKENLPHVSIIDIPVHETVLPHIFARFNCLVGFSKGESTWLPGIQAMAMGIPIIQLQSECSGYMEYLNDSNSYLCKDVTYKIADEELVTGTSEYYENCELAHGNTVELMEMMKRVKREQHTSTQTNKIFQAELEAQGWSWTCSINQLNKFFNDYVFLKKD